MFCAFSKKLQLIKKLSVDMGLVPFKVILKGVGIEYISTITGASLEIVKAIIEAAKTVNPLTRYNQLLEPAKKIFPNENQIKRALNKMNNSDYITLK